MTDNSASDRVFEAAADLFSLLSTPTRLRIVCELCRRELNVGQLLQGAGVTQPNISRHLNALYRAGVVARRRSGSQMFYRVVSERVLLLCEAVCDERDRLQAAQNRNLPAP